MAKWHFKAVLIILCMTCGEYFILQGNRSDLESGWWLWVSRQDLKSGLQDKNRLAFTPTYLLTCLQLTCPAVCLELVDWGLLSLCLLVVGFHLLISAILYIENSTWARVDMDFLFECSTWYLMSERSERVRYKVDHKKINSISISNLVLFYYINILMMFLTIFWRFLNTFWTLSEDFQRFSKSCLKARQMFPNIFQKCPKISKDNWWLPKIAKEDPMMYWSYSNTFKYSLRDSCNHNNHSFHLKITCYFHVFLRKSSPGISLVFILYNK